MKKLTLVLCILLAACASAPIITVEKEIIKPDTTPIDEKIEILKQEQAKLEEIRKNIEKQVTESKRPRPTYQYPPASGLFGFGMPRPAPPLPAPAPSAKIETEPIGGGAIIIQKPKTVIKLNTKPKQTENITVAEQLFKTQVVFAVPSKANVKDEIKAQLIIDPVKTVKELKEAISSTSTVQSADTIEISRIAIARIHAPDFTITFNTSEEQAIAESKQTEWVWGLRPKTPGMHPIRVTLEAEVKVGDKNTKHHMRQFEKQVFIDISTTQTIAHWWNKYWQWVIASLLIPIGKIIYERKYKSQKSVS